MIDPSADQADLLFAERFAFAFGRHGGVIFEASDCDDQSAFFTVALGENFAVLAAFENGFEAIDSELALLFLGAVALEAGLLEDGFDVFVVGESGLGGGRREFAQIRSRSRGQECGDGEEGCEGNYDLSAHAVLFESGVAVLRPIEAWHPDWLRVKKIQANRLAAVRDSAHCPANVFMNRSAHISRIFLLALALLLSPIVGRAAAPEDPLQQQTLRQEQLRATTARIGGQLDQVLTDFDLNGISGEDVKILRAIRSVLSRLTEQDMQKVLTLLQDARQTNQGNGGQIAEAFSGQQGIVTQLRQLLAEYNRQQAVYDIAIRLKELASRQTDNMRLAVWLARQVDRKTLQQYQETQRLNLQLQESEESSLRAETSQVLDQLDKLVALSADAPTAERPRKALQRSQEGGLVKGIDTSTEDLKAGRLLGAAGNEKRVRDLMREVARMLTQSLDKKDAIREAVRELDIAMEKQQRLTDLTRKVVNKEDALKREGDEAEVVDLTDLIRRDVLDLVPTSAQHLQSATDRMQDARAALMSGDNMTRVREQAIAQQGEAQTKMEQARRDLLDQLNKSDTPSQLPQKSLAAIEVLQQKVQEMIQRQESLRKDAGQAPKDKLTSLAPKQGEIKDQAQETQQQAADLSPAASEALGDAAAQMERSQKTLAEERNQDPVHQAALDALARAAQALSKEKERLEQAEKDLAELEALLKKLIAIIQEEQELFSETTRAALKTPTPDTSGTANAQLRLSDRTRALEGEVRKKAPKAGEHLDLAVGFMNQAREQLAQKLPLEAQPKESSALKELYAARKALEKNIGDLKEQLGEDPQEESSGSMQEAADTIAAAQKDVNEALSQLQNGAANAMQTLKEKQQQIVTDLAQPMIAAPSTTIAKREGESAVSKLTQAQLPAAIESMKAALGAMDQGIKANQPNAADGAPNMPTVRDQQKEVLAMAQTVASAMKNASTASMQKASDALQRAGKKLQPLSAGQKGKLPPAAQGEVEAAQEDVDSGAAEAGEKQGGPAQASAQRASQHLAQAQAALALAQSGLSSDNQQQASNSQGQGKKPGQGKTKRSQQGQPGPQGDGREGNWKGQGGAEGPTQNATGGSRFTGLPARDRAAIQQSQGEAYPQEYAPLVEQYLRNLADQAESK